jgi:exopolysaccharide production protein ExoY
MAHEEQGGAASPAHPEHVASLPGWKRPLDGALVVLSFPLWAPLMLVIGWGIKLFSKGPILFKQERVGFKGRRFTCLKFRTMKINADATGHQQYLKTLMHSQQPMTKMDAAGDPRLIPGGSLLRATGLDELPQLFNVLRGEMSLVGPRPCTTYEYASYLPWHLERFETLPGLTGLWQVSGKNKTTFSEMMLLDVAYARQKSVWTDVKILFKTLPATVFQVWETLWARRPAPPRREDRARGGGVAVERSRNARIRRWKQMPVRVAEFISNPRAKPD